MNRLKNTLSIVLVSVMLLTGCSSATGDTATSVVDTATSIEEAIINTSSEIVLDTEFTAKDLEIGYEDSTATHIVLNSSKIEVSGDGATATGSVLTIENEGTYVITGTLSEGQIIVAAEETDKVQIVLNGVNITCSNSAPIYIKNADKVFITLKENTINNLSDGIEYIQSDENIVDGVIFSMVDLTLNGEGALNIDANYKHGIISKDELVFTGGAYQITAVKDAINGKDCVKIKDGSFTLKASTGNGIQSKNGEDATTGYVYISGGTVTVESSVEGIEGTAIIIEGGVVDITATDDGFNASSKDATVNATTEDTVAVENTTDIASNENGLIEVVATATNTSTNTLSSTTIPANRDNKMRPGGGFGGGGEMENDINCYISISGGKITINASGDGIDSNGSVYISGGEIYVSGPTENGNAGLDYNGSAEITGGSIIVAGSTGMAQGFSDTSSQFSLLYNLTSISEAGSEVLLSDENGNAIISFIPSKAYQSVVISSPELESGKTYQLSSGDQTVEITLTSVVTSNAQGRAGRMNGFGQGDMTRPDKGN